MALSICLAQGCHKTDIEKKDTGEVSSAVDAFLALELINGVSYVYAFHHGYFNRCLQIDFSLFFVSEIFILTKTTHSPVPNPEGYDGAWSWDFTDTAWLRSSSTSVVANPSPSGHSPRLPFIDPRFV